MASYRFTTGDETIEIPLKADIRKIYLEATTECNYACVTCIRHSWGTARGHMDEATFARFLAGLPRLPELETIHFGGFGEPLSHPRIVPMLAACKTAGYKVEMITNGSLLSGDIAGELIALGLDWLYISLDGPAADSFAKIRPGADFDAVVANITRLQSLKNSAGRRQPRLGIEFVATKSNFAALPAMRKLVDSLGAEKFIITNVLPYHESMKAEILYDGAADLDGFGHDSVLLSVRTSPNMRLRTRRSCKFVQDKACAVTFEGNVSPCYAFMHSHRCYILGREKNSTAHHFGAIREKHLDEIWTDPRYAQFRWAVRTAQYPSCTDCRQVDGCAIAQGNEIDCWGNQPSCGDCLWAREIVTCP